MCNEGETLDIHVNVILIPFSAWLRKNFNLPTMTVKKIIFEDIVFEREYNVCLGYVIFFRNLGIITNA